MVSSDDAARHSRTSFSKPNSTSSSRTESTRDLSSSDENSAASPSRQVTASRTEMLKILQEADPEMTQSQRLAGLTPVRKTVSQEANLMNPLDDEANLSNDSFGFGQEDWWDTTPTNATEAPKKNTSTKKDGLRSSRHGGKSKKEPKSSSSKNQKASQHHRVSLPTSQADAKLLAAVKTTGVDRGRRRISVKELEELGIDIPSSRPEQPKLKSRARSKSRGGRLAVRQRAQSRGRSKISDTTSKDDSSKARSKSLGRARSKSRGRSRRSLMEDDDGNDFNIPDSISIEMKPTEQVRGSPALVRAESVVSLAQDKRTRRLPSMEHRIQQDDDKTKRMQSPLRKFVKNLSTRFSPARSSPKNDPKRKKNNLPTVDLD